MDENAKISDGREEPISGGFAGGSAAGPDFAAAVQPSYLRTVFLGPEGLRAGWGFAF